jgi:hypothetical protein
VLLPGKGEFSIIRKDGVVHREKSNFGKSEICWFYAFFKKLSFQNCSDSPQFLVNYLGYGTVSFVIVLNMTNQLPTNAP